jgi:hypothetical protein
MACGMACSSSSGGLSESSFESQFCSLLEPCCADAGLSTSGMQCQAFVALAASQSTYDASKGQACLSALQQASSQAGFCATFGGNLPACSGVFASSSGGGKVPAGGTCMLTTDCATAPGGSATCFMQTTFGDAGSTSSTSTCVQISAGKAGDHPCIGTSGGQDTLYFWPNAMPVPAKAVVCNVSDGVTCDQTTLVCTALAPAGQPCMLDGDCVVDDYCSFSSTGSSTCAPRIANGASCMGLLQGACATTAYCDQATSVCKPKLASGVACTGSLECQGSSCDNGKCATSGISGLSLLCGT